MSTPIWEFSLLLLRRALVIYDLNFKLAGLCLPSGSSGFSPFSSQPSAPVLSALVVCMWTFARRDKLEGRN